MAAITGAAIAVGTAAYSASQQKKAAKQGANAMQKATDQTVAEQQRQYDQNRQDQMPWMDAGKDALTRQNAFLNGDTSGFENSADYKFAVDQGFKGLNRGLARNGALWSGGGDADRIALGQGLATQYGNNYWAKLADRAGQGLNTAQSLGQAGQNKANSISGALGNNALARASAYQQRADANSQMASAIGGAVNKGVNYFNAGGWNPSRG